MAPSQPSFSFILLFFLSLLSLPNLSSSLSTISISQTPTRTIICALIPSQNKASFLNCTSFPEGGLWNFSASISRVSASAVAGGTGFVCALSSLGVSSNVSLHCWRFSGNGTVLHFRRKKIYTGPPLLDLRGGEAHLCAVVAGGNRSIECWQWPGFNSPDLRNMSRIAVGGEFLCMLSNNGSINCTGSDQEVLNTVPRGNYSAIAAGVRRACAIALNGTIRCWGARPVRVEPTPAGEFEAVALGGNRTCGIRANGTSVCWGENFGLPESLRQEQFISIEGKDGIFCGVLKSNYSLVCWGAQMFESNHLVFKRVLPGPCTKRTECKTVLPDSGSLCTTGVICQECRRQEDFYLSPQPPPPPAAIRWKSGRSKAVVAFLVVGSVGTAIGIAFVAYFVVRFCRGNSCRVHDSGRLDEATPPDASSSRRQVRHPTLRVESGLGLRSRLGPTLEKRLSHIFSMGTSGHLEEFHINVLIEATHNFSNDHRIGSGSFGSVYRGTLGDGRVVAIKRSELSTTSSYVGGGPTKRQEKDTAFLSELAFLSRVNHKNLVRLQGFCEEGNEQLLVYEFMINGSFYEHLHTLESSPLMAWIPRLKVALDAARGVEYLHTYAVPPIIHRDIKSSNILIDEKWTAKVSDFGLSLMGPDEDTSHLSLRAAGTVGYMDPEYYRLQQLTTKSDVYSFGVVLLELLSGYKAIHRVQQGGTPRNVVDFIVPYIVSDEIHRVLDPRLPPPTPYEIEAVTYVAYLASDCVRLEGKDRPSMTEVVASLERALAVCALSPSSTTEMST